MTSAFDYQHVSKRSPFITLVVAGADLSRYTPTGDGATKLTVYRVGADYDTWDLGLLEQVGNKFTFAATTDMLNMNPGRYAYKFYYKGNYIGTKQFILDKPTLEIRSV